MEARSESQHRMKMNLQAGWSSWVSGRGTATSRYPIEGDPVVKAGAAKHFSFLPQEISSDPQ